MKRGITEVSVERLFGRYDYRLSLANEGETDAPQVSMLYGDNGSGKTTILDLVFHLLSPEDDRGHKSFVARAPFRRFSVLLSDQTRFTAVRSSHQLVGGFDLELTLDGETTKSARFDIDPVNGSITEDSISPSAMDIIESITGLGMEIFYLKDNRDLQSDTFPRPESRGILGRDWRVESQPENLRFSHEYDWKRPPREQFEGRASVLDMSIRLAERKLNLDAIRASTVGETEARQSYADILQTAATANTPEQESLNREVNRLSNDLEELARISAEFEEFGLSSVIDADSLSTSLADANPMTLPVVVSVLGSFLDGQRVRLNALSTIYRRVQTFVSIINHYLKDKTIKLDLLDGFSIELPTGRLNPNLLSSGERNLLLLFLNVLSSSDRSPIYLIDEPELSLNFKWQRLLVDSLLELSSESQSQFLLATHSFELIGKHRDLVVLLREANE